MASRAHFVNFSDTNPSFRLPSGSGLTNDGDKWFGTSPEMVGQGSRKRLAELARKAIEDEAVRRLTNTG